MKYFSLLLIITSFQVGELIAQTKSTFTLGGKLTTTGGWPASYASVQMKRLRWHGVSCDINGQFALRQVQAGDTITFTAVNIKPAYFVADRLYDFLEITVDSDTLVTLDSNYADKADYYRNKYYVERRRYVAAPVVFKETREKVKQPPPPAPPKALPQPLMEEDDNSFFRRVEIIPFIMIPKRTFVERVSLNLSHLRKKYLPLGTTSFRVLYSFRSKANITEIQGNCSKEVKAMVEHLFEAICFSSDYGGVFQNGYAVGVTCMADFEITRKRKKKVSIKLINPVTPVLLQE